VATVLALGLGLGLYQTAAARQGGHGGPGGPDPGARLESQIEQLDLDEETRKAVYAILDESRVAQRDLRDQAREAREILHSLMQEESPDQGAVMAQADEVGAIHTEMRKNGLRTMLQVQQLLTTEQRETLRESFKGRRGRRGDRGDRGERGCDGGDCPFGRGR
jgi:Spy/CpxP family protein refolding chaperone